MTSGAHAESPLDEVCGLVFLGFPLHAPGKPGTERADHLTAVRVPMLFLQGTRDDFARLDLITEVAPRWVPMPRLELFDGADHSLDRERCTVVPRAEVQEDLAATIAAWADLGPRGADRMIAPSVPSSSSAPSDRGSLGPLLVLAGPGAGKTFCLIERDSLSDRADGSRAPADRCRHLHQSRPPERSRTGCEAHWDSARTRSLSSTIHALCVQLLRQYGSAIGLSQGFGIADEEYQAQVLRRAGLS